jgi:hypothetical protein
LIDGLTAGQVLVAALLVVAFMLPGVWAVARWDAEGRFSWPGRIALGFVAAFGTFSALTGPLLLSHQPGRSARIAALAGWAVAFVACLAWPRRSSPPRAAMPPDPAPELAALPPSWLVPVAGLCLASLAGSLVFATALAPRRLALAACALVFAANGWLLLRGRRLPPRAWSAEQLARLRPLQGVATAGACLLFAVALLATTFWVREDSDDTLYISEALVLPSAPAMVAENAVHRGENLPANELYDWQAFELWGGLLAQASGVHPMILFRTLFAPLVLLLAAAGGFEILRRTLPRGSLGVGMGVALAYYLFGITSHWTANNYLLPRPAQGKTWLVHVAIPVVVLLTYELMSRPARSTWLLLLLAVFAALGFAPMALYLVPSALLALLLAYTLLWPRSTNLRVACAAAATLLPLIGWALYLAGHLDPQVAEAVADRTTPGRWHDDFFFGHLNFDERGGGLELFPLIALPLAGLFLSTRAQLFYSVAFTVLLFVTVLNPLAHMLIGGSLTGWEGYRRLFWLVPYPLLMGILAAGLLRMTAVLRSPTLAGPGVLAAFLLAMPLTGGAFVFGPANPSGGISPAPYRALNPYKMPEPLRQLAEVLVPGRHGPDDRILCSDRTASHLAPLVRDFDFVFTRGYQTRASLHFAGRFEEAREREQLGGPFLEGALAPEYAAALLAEHKVRYVIVELDSAPTENALAQAGFERTAEFAPYRLWTRKPASAKVAAPERPAP